MMERFEDIARELIFQMGLRPGAVSMRQYKRNDGQRIIVAACEPDKVPSNAPVRIGEYEVEYQLRTTIHIRD